MIFIALAIPLLAALFTGVGLLFFRPASPLEVGPASEDARQPALFESLLVAFWVGWALVIALLQIWHLFFPVNNLLLGFVSGAGLVGWIGARRQILPAMRGWLSLSGLALAGLALLPALVLASHVFFVPPHYDHGLYHMQTVRWNLDYAIVPGLANLHHRLAFNNANFLYAALLDNGPLAGRAFFLSNTLLAYVLILQCAAGFYGLFQSGLRPRASQLYYALMLPGVLWHFSTTHLPGYSPDVVVFALQAVIGGELLRLFEHGPGEAKSAARQAARIVLLAAAGVTVKLSFAVFGALALLAVLLFWWLRVRPGRADAARRLGIWAGLAGLLIVPWLARGVLLSGYLLFPSAALPLPVAWRAPEALVAPISPIILEWARTVNQTIPYTADLAWLRQWYAAFPFDVVKRSFLLAAAVLALTLALLAWLRLRRAGKAVSSNDTPTPWKDPRVLASGALAAITAFSLLGWFLLAPDYRFSGALIWMLLASGLCLAFFLLQAAGLLREPLRLAAALLVGLTILISPNQFELHKPGGQTLLPQPEAEWVKQFEPPAPLETRVTTSGLTVNVPEESSDQCFNMPLPCTRVQDFHPGLSLFEPDDLQRGFFIHP